MTDTDSSSVVVTKDLVRQVQQAARGKFATVRLYLANLVSVTPKTRGSVFRAAVRLAAIGDELSAGRCPVVSPDFTDPHWAGAFIFAVENFFDEERRRYKLRVRFLIVTGQCAGNFIESTWSSGFAGVMRSEIGASLRGKESQYQEARNLNLLRMLQCAVFLTQRQTINVSKVSATKTMQASNKRLTRSRFREISECPFRAPFHCVHCSATTADCDRAITPNQG